jgi:hypothetical protein
MAHFYFIAVNIGQIIVNISQLYLFVKYFFINNLILIIMLYSVKKDLLHNILWCFSMARYSHLKWTDRRFYTVEYDCCRWMNILLKKGYV